VIKEAIDRILGLAEPTFVNINGKPYTNQSLKQILPPLRETVIVGTLEGLKDYVLKHTPIGEPFTVQIKSSTEVLVISEPDENGRITTFAKAVFAPPQLPTERWLNMESFLISGQAFFVQDNETARLFQLVGNLTDEAIKTVADDGVTQRVTAKTGLARVENVDVRNPFQLSPYRTFPEIDQPWSRFILRIRRGTELEAALFEVRDGMWVFSAVNAIKAWFLEAMPTWDVIA